jgi:hypothetical protein
MGKVAEKENLNYDYHKKMRKMVGTQLHSIYDDSKHV